MRKRPKSAPKDVFIDRLVVGGGRAEGFPTLREADLSLNLDADAIPHVQGDINWAPFAAAAFDEVYFEKVPYDSFCGKNVGAVREASRILRPGGKLVIETGSQAPIHEIRIRLKVAGFRFMRITDRGYIRISARKGGV